MKFRIVSLSLVSVLAACSSLKEARLSSSAPNRAPNWNTVEKPAENEASQPRTRVAWRQEQVVHPNKVNWFHSGLYFGGVVGWAQTDADESDIDSDLTSRGYTGVSTDLDTSDIAWKLFGGYRFERPFAMELAAVDLGKIESRVTADPPADVNAFLNDLADVHPFSAKGIALTGTWYALDQEDWQVGLKGGLWWWDGEVEAKTSSGQRVSQSDRSLDFVFGAVGSVDVSDQWSLRAEVEHYRINSDGVTLLAVGAQWSPRRSNRGLTPVPSISGLPPALLRRNR